MACETCKVKFSLFTRKKQCMDCLRYFCSECVIKRLDKIFNCESCNLLSRRPLIQNQIVQVRSKDLRQYLLAKKVPIEGCIEKEDLIKLLMTFANGTSNYWNTEDAENIHGSPSNQSATTNYEYNVQDLNQNRETNAATISRINFYANGRAESIHSQDEKVTKMSDTFVESIVDPVKLSDINTLSELEHLSMKQLKNLLSTNRVDYKGCIEKYELLDKAFKLWEEYKRSKTKVDIPDADVCKICWDEPMECVFLECGHVVCCLNCGKQMSECPICKQYVVRIVRLFKA
ncbi:PREDICTED: E3 ubiquitin-protein ligase RNF34 [Habropoda laboriosa]|uniref:E3 ubiquitin-protein ligase RNF34 n=1 Tax=Habropoda laboriosa TaxID=597456 RepID=UPI00083D7D08|nr:PREDICTED: E3 ubiquitin-protein ligase RNF34 [Habropoda laboriosa]